MFKYIANQNILPATVLLLLINSISFGQASSSQNYVMTNTVKQAGITTEPQVNSLLIATQGKGQTINYFDGLGRPLQNVTTNGSATQHDLIVGMEYDSLGREVIKYLPYSDIGNTSTPGGYRLGWKLVQGTFYSSGTMTNVDTSTAPFSVSVMEPSPLNRVFAQGAPGTTWQPNLSNPHDPSSHSFQTKYLENKPGDSIRYFIVNNAGTISSTKYYDTNTITIKVSIDEQQQTVKEYKDLFGNIILKRVLISGDSLQTYYIYDSLNLLRAVIQPEGTVVLKNNSWAFPSGFNSNWMFLYRYDERKRMVMKKVPGADSVNILYDQWDRPVLVQDGNLRVSHFWLFTKYDQLNRPIVTGQITDTRALSAVQTDVTNSTGRFETVSTSAAEGYTLNTSFPSSSSYTLTVYTTTHYDSYSNLPSWNSGYAFVNEDGISAYNNNLTGQVVATQIKILGTSNFNRTVSYYDDKYRIIQASADNADGGKDRITNILSFDGKTTADYHNHTSRFFTTPLLTKEVYSYDQVDRLLTLTHQTAAQEVVILSQNAYNEVGQSLSKKLHQSPSHPNTLQKLDYSYNIRGWLNGINKTNVTDTSYQENDLFNLELHYTNSLMPGASLQYNGNVAEEILKNGYDEAITGYSFQYDKANRLNSSAWGSYTGTSWNQANGFNESGISYDHNGNIMTLNRYMGSWNNIDSLKYQNYLGNQLGKVVDLAPVNMTNTGFQDKDNGTGSDYIYDLNGNIKSDYNKSIASITYNYLNLPNVITISGKGTVTYTYDAIGKKLQKTIVDTTVHPNKTTNYYYAGDCVYRNDTLEFISHPEGRLRPVKIDTTQVISIANLKYIYDYYLKDHLGSVRSVLTTEQQTDIYAVTMESANSAKENALFSNISSTDTAKPAGFGNDNNSHFVSKLNGDGTAGNKRVGPSIVLKVMTGDTISISTYSWYKGSAQSPPVNPPSIYTELLPLLTSGVTGLNGAKGGTVPSSISGPALGTDLANLISFDSTTYSSSTSRPKAFMNWMVVGEDYVAATSSLNHVYSKQVPVCNPGDTAQQIVGPANMVVRRNGWIYIYLSNESAQSVYFDNLVINLKHGPLVEQKDYYAFGMENPVLSTQALKPSYIPNRMRYNGKELQAQEFVDGSGLAWDDYGARMYDPEIGRWMVVDPMSDKNRRWSPYNYAVDNAMRFIDPDGMNILDGIAHSDNAESSNKQDEDETKYFKVLKNNMTKKLTTEDIDKDEYDQGASSMSKNPSAITYTYAAKNKEGDQFKEYRKNGGEYNYRGGNVQNWTNVDNNKDRYAVFTKLKSGEMINFPLAEITDSWVFKNEGYTLSDGSIHASLSFNLALLEHEYGHFLQAMFLGKKAFEVISQLSLVNAAVHSTEEHRRFWTEVDASTRAAIFFGPKSDIELDKSQPKEGE